MKFYVEVQHRWLASLICAALSLLALGVDHAVSPGEPTIAAVLAMALSLIAGVIGVLSLLAKERRRALAMAGICLSIAPWLVISVLS